jgi:hypothetical protein
VSRSLRLLPTRGDEWYRDGVRFGCTGSGKCCFIHGEHAYVYFTREEELAIAGHLGLQVKTFRRRHTRRTSFGPRTLRFPDGRCTFLHENRCSIYAVRPEQCRTWPFWPENMDPAVWEREVAAFCPGVGRGRRYSLEEIRAILEGRGGVDTPGAGG